MPPFAGVAVNVIAEPLHAGFVPEEIEMETAGTNVPLTFIVMELEDPFAGFAQFAFDVSMQVITSPFASAEEEYVSIAVPTLLPFNCH